MFCSHCGGHLSPETKICSTCDAPVAAEAAAPPQPSGYPPMQPAASAQSQTAKSSLKGRYLLFGVGGAALGAILLAVVLLLAGVFSSSGGIDGKMEGPGFATPEDAAKAYLNGLRDLDIDAMVSTFAVESYTEHYDLNAVIERLGAYTSGMEMILPNTTSYTRRLNIEFRRSHIADMIKDQYFCFNTPDVLVDKPSTIELIDPAETSEFLETLKNDVKEYAFDDLVITGSKQPEELTDVYLLEQNQKNLGTQVKPFGVSIDDVANVVITFNADGRKWLFCPEAIRYNGKWYLESLSGNLTALIGIAVYAGGIVPADNLDL